MDDSCLKAGDVPVSELERHKPSIDIHSKLEIVKDSNGECSMLARPILPTDVHQHLVDHKDEIYSILTAGFNEDFIRLNDVSPAGEFEAQRAFISCSNEFELAADEMEYGPSTPTSDITLSSETFGGGEGGGNGNGNDTAMPDNGPNESDNPSRRCSEEGDGPDDDDSDDNTDGSFHSAISAKATDAGLDKSGGGDLAIGPSPSGVGVDEPYAAFDIRFKVKPSLSCRDMHYLRLKGTLESKELGTQYYTSPDTISASRVRFRQLDFHHTCNMSHSRKESYRQFYARVNVETSRKCPIYLNDVYPNSSQRILVDGTTKVTEAKEQTGGCQFIGSAITSWLPFLATVSPSVSVSKTQTHKAALAKEHTERTEQVDTSRGLRWGYHVDDEWTRQNGLRLTDTPSRLPTAQFDFLGREAGCRCPEKLNVTVRSYWSLSPASESGGLVKANREVHFQTWHVHRDVNAWVGHDCSNHKLGGQVKDTYVTEMGIPFYVLNDRDCMAQD
ncbi:hypothetical protein BDZ89DRAFT_1066244 [Hymenopellis radicata]|nr:hypothetical protein BDZ89DRAFT_1066244 [Hymenopellis radicata]